MADITRPTLAGPGLMPVSRSGPWAVNDDETDAVPPVPLKDAPGTGKALYLTHVTMSGRTNDVAITLQDEDDNVLFGPIQMQADGGGVFTKDWKHPLKLIDDKALEVVATDGEAFTIYVEGFTGQAPIV